MATKPAKTAKAAAKVAKLIDIDWAKVDPNIKIESLEESKRRPHVTPFPQNAQTHTPAFKRWFGNSKVVDSKGNPLVVYHGSLTGGFSAFSHDKIDAHHAGFFFTSNRKMAQSYVGEGKWDDPTPEGKYTLKEVLKSWPTELRSVCIYIKKFTPEFSNIFRQYWEMQFENMTPKEADYCRSQIDQVLKDPTKMIVDGSALLFGPTEKSLGIKNLQDVPKRSYIKTYPATAQEALDLGYTSAFLYASDAYKEIMLPEDSIGIFGRRREQTLLDHGKLVYSLENARLMRYYEDGNTAASIRRKTSKSDEVRKQFTRLLEIESALDSIEVGEFGLIYRDGDKQFFDPASNKNEAKRLLEYVNSPSIAQIQIAGIYAVYLSIQDPLVVDANGATWSNIEVKVNGRETARVNTDKLCYAAKRMGHDGVIILNVFDSGGKLNKDSGAGDVYVAFNPTQIKSATKNKGTFDSNDVDIRHNPASSRTFIPPAAVAEEARLGLAIRAQQPPSQRCCTPVGLRRAVQLMDRQPVSVRTLKRMRSYFQRHAVDAQGARWDDPYNPSKGRVAWMLWGGNAGRKWCNKLLDSLGE